MPLGKPVVSAICDTCEDVSDQVEMHVGWNVWLRWQVYEKIHALGWRVQGPRMICPACVENEREKAENSELARLSGEHDADALAALKAGLG